MKRNHKIAVYVITAVSAIALVLLICNAITSVRKQTEAHCFNYLNEATDRLAGDLYKTADMDHTILTAMASLIAVESDTSDDNLCTIMSSFVTKTSYVNYVEILRPDNTMLDADGNVRDVSTALDFTQEAEKGAYISDIDFSTKSPGERIIRNAVPVQKDGKTVYILYGVLRLTDFAKNYTTNIYDGNAYVYLVDGNTGDLLLDTWHNSFGNISDFYDRKSISGGSFEEVAADLKAGTPGDFAFVSQSTGDTLYMHYEPVGFNNWSVLVTVQDRYALKDSKEINRTLFVTAAECGVILLCYMLFVTLSLLSAYHRIRRLGMTDQVTGLPNRNAYDAYLIANRKRTYRLVSCVFVDVNGLHELNNLKGHDAGDRMLHCVGEAMQTAFPTKLVYRTGGDEFVAIIENMAEDACKAGATRMSEILAQNGYSVAYGVVTQQNATDISEITRLADERMIENKKLYYSKHDRRMR